MHDSRGGGAADGQDAPGVWACSGMRHRSSLVRSASSEPEATGAKRRATGDAGNAVYKEEQGRAKAVSKASRPSPAAVVRTRLKTSASQSPTSPRSRGGGRTASRLRPAAVAARPRPRAASTAPPLHPSSGGCPRRPDGARRPRPSRRAAASGSASGRQWSRHEPRLVGRAAARGGSRRTARQTNLRPHWPAARAAGGRHDTKKLGTCAVASQLAAVPRKGSLP